MTPTSSSSRRITAVAAFILAGWIAAACGGSDSGSESADQSPPPAAAADDNDADSTDGDTNGDDANGDNGRAFDSTDDAVITALTTASKADEVAWDGSTIVLTYNEGSIEDPTASIMCLAAQAVIADDESVRIVYPDGDLDCDDRPGA